ncbi:hypothetical protein KI387_034795, partial [Taxus chinensis]
VSWISWLQKVVALSTTEAEYVSSIEVIKEMIWLHHLLDELGHKQEVGRLHSDSQRTINLAKNSDFQSRMKHIQLRYHFIIVTLEEDKLKLEKIHTSKNSADDDE